MCTWKCEYVANTKALLEPVKSFVKTAWKEDALEIPDIKNRLIAVSWMIVNLYMSELQLFGTIGI